MKLKLSNEQIKRIAKSIKGYTPEEFDEVLEQDEASAQFQKAEEMAREFVNDIANMGSDKILEHVRGLINKWIIEDTPESF